MSIERPTFSPLWHRVRGLKPRLRPHVQVTRQLYRGRRWHVVHDPSANNFYRLTPVAFEFLSALGGQTTVEQAWDRVLSRHGDNAPTQPEIVELIGQLYGANLLAMEAPPEVEQLLHRRRERIRKKVMQQAVGLLYFRLRLLNPDRLLAALEPMFRPVLNRWGFLAWCVLVAAAVLAVLPAWPRLAGGFDEYVSPANAGWMLAVFVVLKLWHELGHGLICKRLGGQVPEAGVMLLVLLPSPYVDASSAWSFENKWQRVAVGAGGMIFELFAAAVAAFVWLALPDGMLAKQLAYYAMLTASISTLLFNINPLMRFDGYYMLADLIEVPNLMMRSNQYIHYLFQRYVYRVEQPRIVSTLPGERAILLTYGLLAMAYRVVLMLTIALWVMGLWFIIGVALAIWTIGAWLLIPAGKFVHWLATHGSLTDRRGRAIVVTLGMLAGVALLLGAVPVPDWRRARGVVESRQETGVYFDSSGFVREALARRGTAVRAGDVLARLESPELERSVLANRAEREELLVVLQQSRAGEDAASAGIAAAQLAVNERERLELEDRVRGLTVRAPHDGVVVGGDPSLAVGAFVKRGELLCAVVDPADLRVAATVPTAQGAWLRTLPPDRITSEFRTASRPFRVVSAAEVSSPSAAQAQLPHAALGFSGGGQVPTEPEDREGVRTMFPQYVVYLRAGEGLAGAPLGQPGERVWVRFTLPGRPVAAQLWERLRQVLQGRVNL
jgi:putative peptide zinc metalloprotease protein